MPDRHQIWWPILGIIRKILCLSYIYRASNDALSQFFGHHDENYDDAFLIVLGIQMIILPKNFSHLSQQSI